MLIVILVDVIGFTGPPFPPSEAGLFRDIYEGTLPFFDPARRCCALRCRGLRLHTVRVKYSTDTASWSIPLGFLATDGRLGTVLGGRRWAVERGKVWVGEGWPGGGGVFIALEGVLVVVRLVSFLFASLHPLWVGEGGGLYFAAESMAFSGLLGPIKTVGGKHRARGVVGARCHC